MATLETSHATVQSTTSELAAWPEGNENPSSVTARSNGSGRSRATRTLMPVTSSAPPPPETTASSTGRHERSRTATAIATAVSSSVSPALPPMSVSAMTSEFAQPVRCEATHSTIGRSNRVRSSFSRTPSRIARKTLINATATVAPATSTITLCAVRLGTGSTPTSRRVAGRLAITTPNATATVTTASATLTTALQLIAPPRHPSDDWASPGVSRSDVPQPGIRSRRGTIGSSWPTTIEARSRGRCSSR
ncbi:hypothetical protein GCM10009539_60650 [Cryptosporangium japonicum]|uniref:Uncharacterized protein n=1 Tax=Cryptosporangium japonicum TaxID=80872 RepID=A0ABN0UYL7_9ACTN